MLSSSDLRPHSRKIWVITTACLPWMTGTSINPLLRAAYLAADRPDGAITLMVPFLPRDDQDVAFPPGVRFDCPSEQEKHVRDWLVSEARMPEAARKLRIVFYSARYHDEFHSIFPMGDITELVPDEDADVCILEEPEHLSWYRAPFTSKPWNQKFRHVIGIIHTNYLSVSMSAPPGAMGLTWIHVCLLCSTPEPRPRQRSRSLCCTSSTRACAGRTCTRS